MAEGELHRARAQPVLDGPARVRERDPCVRLVASAAEELVRADPRQRDPGGAVAPSAAEGARARALAAPYVGPVAGARVEPSLLVGERSLRRPAEAVFARAAKQLQHRKRDPHLAGCEPGEPPPRRGEPG